MHISCRRRGKLPTFQSSPAIAVAVVVALVTVRGIAQVGQVKTGNDRVDRLLKELSLHEKISLIHGSVESDDTNQGQAGYLPGVPRLGIPPMRFADGTPVQTSNSWGASPLIPIVRSGI